jgi:TolA-binding protein
MHAKIKRISPKNKLIVMNPNNKNITQEVFERIESYLNNTMSQEDFLTFEEQLKSDSTLQKQVTEHKILFEAVETQSLKEQLNEFHKLASETEMPKIGTSKVRSLQLRKLAIAASLIIAAGYFLFFNGSTNEKLYTNYFTPDPGLVTTMSSNSNFEFYDAMVNYKQGDYKKAISKWEVLQQNKPKNDTLNYFLGVAHLANKNEDSAILFLALVTKTSKSTFKSDAYYYLGLAYLKANNVELAKKNLTFSDVDNSKALLTELND